MTSKTIVRSLILAFALLAWAGCKKEGTTPAGAKGDPVVLLEVGAEPRAPLRYKIAEGTVTKSNMDFTMATLATTDDAAALSVVPGVRLHIVSGPAMVTDSGAKFEVNITKAEAAIPQGLDQLLVLSWFASAVVWRRGRRIAGS